MADETTQPGEVNGEAADERPLRIIVEGFKCFKKREEFELPGLTLLAGRNSSGKTSAMQPLWLLKQTLESPVDPGPLLLDGPLVSFENSSELLWRKGKGDDTASFCFGFGVPGGAVETVFGPGKESLEIRECIVHTPRQQIALGMDNVAEVARQIALEGADSKLSGDLLSLLDSRGVTVERARDRFALHAVVRKPSSGERRTLLLWGGFLPQISSSIVVPGLRGNPKRVYPLSTRPSSFSGPFLPAYVAGILWTWQQDDDRRQARITEQLRDLGLTWKVEVRRRSEVHAELLVGRLPTPRRGGAKDLVNISDVGFGVSQVLPVLVALLVAEPGQIVTIEQPELHLHPEAQAALARCLVDAAKRGVLVVAETHSPLLLLATQTLMTEDALPPDKVRLYWFDRDEEGAAVVTPGLLDESGAYHEWPVDFWNVERRHQLEFIRSSLDRG